MATAQEKLDLARRHLERVRVAWDPPDWADLSMYGFYALEAAVEAASIHYGFDIPKAHWARVQAAELLTEQHGLEAVDELLRDLNETRKSVAYGDVSAPELEAEEVAGVIEEFVSAVARLVEP
jgi:HEPN domain-containing protein